LKSVPGWQASGVGNKDVVMINISHHGAVSGVTGSCHKLLVGQSDKQAVSSLLLRQIYRNIILHTNI